MKCPEPTKLHRKSEMWGTRSYVAGTERRSVDLPIRNQSVDGASPRLFRPMYAGGEHGAPVQRGKVGV
jgi:hypothetical protein